MIELNNVSKIFQGKSGEVRALQNASLTVEQGEIFGVIGPSGAGKSTLLRCVNLLEVPTHGEVVVAGQNMMSLTNHELLQARRSIGMIFQHFNLLSSKTVYDNIALPLQIAGMSKAEIDDKVMPLVHLTGLEGKLEQYPRQLSGGQKQRVAIARALVTDAKVLLCDEATSALDPQTTHAILQLLLKVRKELGVTILLITHEMEVIKEICDQVAVIQDGELVEQGQVAEVFAKPKTAVTQQFIHSTLRKNLPESIASTITEEIKPGYIPVLRLWFFRQAAAEPIMSQMIRRFYLEVNILQANIEHVQEQVMGIMTLTLRSVDHKKFDQSVAYLSELGVRVEVLGYVPEGGEVS